MYGYNLTDSTIRAQLYDKEWKSIRDFAETGKVYNEEYSGIYNILDYFTYAYRNSSYKWGVYRLKGNLTESNEYAWEPAWNNTPMPLLLHMGFYVLMYS